MSVTVIDSLDAFEAEIAKPGLTVIDFWATWCGPCVRIAPWFKEQAGTNADINFCKVDVDEQEEISAHVGIKCMPTFKFYKNGELLETMEGANKDGLTNLFAKHK